MIVDRLGERDGKAERVSDGETEKEVSARFEGYDVGLSDRDDECSPPKLEIASGYRPSLPSPQPLSHITLPPHAMDISSVRFRPLPVTAQAIMTSTHGHPMLNFPEWGKVNSSTLNQNIREVRYPSKIFCIKCRLIAFFISTVG